MFSSFWKKKNEEEEDLPEDLAEMESLYYDSGVKRKVLFPGLEYFIVHVRSPKPHIAVIIDIPNENLPAQPPLSPPLALSPLARPPLSVPAPQVSHVSFGFDENEETKLLRITSPDYILEQIMKFEGADFKIIRQGFLSEEQSRKLNNMLRDFKPSRMLTLGKKAFAQADDDQKRKYGRQLDTVSFWEDIFPNMPKKTMIQKIIGRGGKTRLRKSSRRRRVSKNKRLKI